MDSRKNKITDFTDSLKAAFFAADAALNSYFKQIPDLINKISNLKDTNYNLAMHHMQSRNFGDAIFRFKLYNYFVPDDLSALYNIGYCYLQKGNNRKAIEAFERLLSVRPDSPEVIYMLALAGARKAVSIPRNIVEQYFEKLAPSYREEAIRQNYRGHTLLLDSLLKSPVEIPFPLEILDIGCGTGLCGEVLRGYAKLLVGVDISQLMIDQARKLVVDGKPTYDELKKAEMHQYLTGETRTLDLVSAALVFNFVGDLTHTFQAVHHALKPKGFFAFSVEKAGNDVTDYALSGVKFAHAEGYVKSLAEKFGFDVLSLTEVELMTGIKGFQCLLQKR